MEPDFSLLYSELKLPPDCSLEEFKCAYRRRIAELHPDKTGGPPSPEAQAALPALISTYDAVNRFHRRHGRMPGASPRSSAGDGHRPAHHPVSRSSTPVQAPTDDDAGRTARPTWQLIILFIALLVLLASWDWLTLIA